MPRRTLTPDEVRALLQDFVHRLAARGDNAAIFVIGGAAIALINPVRTSTRDIDGYVPAVDVSDVVVDLQREWGLDDDWFNHHANGLGPVSGPDMWREAYREADVVLMVATTEALLAMKLNAARGKDTDDICFLLDTLGVVTLERAEEVFETYYPGDVLKDAAVERVKFCLARNT